MSLWDYLKPKNLLRGAAGFLTGGWAGAAASLYAGGQQQKEQRPPQVLNQIGGQTPPKPPYTEIPSPWQAQGGQPAIGTQYREYLQAALAGQQGLPEGYMQQAMQTGQTALSGQAQQSRERLFQHLSQRGMLRSGVAAGGMADIEQAKLAGQAQLAGTISQADIQARMDTQQRAAGLVSSLIAMREAGLAGSAQHQQSLLALAQQAQEAEARGDEATYSAIAEALMAYYQYKNPPQTPALPAPTPINYNLGLPPNYVGRALDTQPSAGWLMRGETPPDLNLREALRR